MVMFVLLAWDSPAWPIALAWLPSIMISVLGRNPFPTGAISIAFFGWTVLALAFAYARGNEALKLRALLTPTVIVTVLLFALLIVRLGASNAYGYGVVKVQLFLAENVAGLVAGIAIARYAHHFRKLLVWLVVVACLTSVVLAHGLAAGATEPTVGGRYSLDQADSPIGLGRSAAQGIMIAIYFVLVVGPPVYRLLALGSLPLIAVSFLASGSRGPVLGLVAGLVVLLGLTVRERRMRARTLLVVVAVFFAGLLVTQLVPGQDIQRSLSVLTGSGGGLSSNGRTTLWSEAWHLFRDHPLFGIGTGGFAAIEPVYSFPHNIFLELGSELGVLGILAVVAVIAGGVLALRHALAHGVLRADVALVGALLTAAVVNAQVSGDVQSNADIWLAVGLAIGLAQRAGVQPLAVRPLRRALGVRRGRPTPEPQQRRPVAEPVRDAGEILVPAEGATVRGIVAVGGRLTRAGMGAAAVRLELSRDGDSWQPAAADASVFDVVHVVDGFRRPLATVRSRQAAELLVDELGRGERDGVVVEKAAGRSSSGRDWWQEWDATALPEGGYLLRAVVTGPAGALAVSSVRRVTVQRAAAAPARSARPELAARAAELERRERELETAAAAARQAVSAREEEWRAQAEAAAREAERRERRDEAERAQRQRDEETHRRRRQEEEKRARETLAALTARNEALDRRERELRAAQAALEMGRRQHEEAERQNLEAQAARQAEEREQERMRRAREAQEAEQRRREEEERGRRVREDEERRAREAQAAQESERSRREEEERQRLERVPVQFPPPSSAPAQAGVDVRVLQRLVREQPHPDRYVQLERETMLEALAPYADANGLLPDSLRDVAMGTFDDLLHG
jgi:O-antigen ligase